MTPHSAIVTILVAIALVATTGTVNAQTTLTDTRIEASGEAPPEADNWTGEPITFDIDVMICWDDAGGTNADQESMTVSSATHTLDGYNATVAPDAVDFVLPAGPTQEAGCTEGENFTAVLVAQDDVMANLSADFTVVFTVTTSEPVGTYASPEESGISFDVTTAPDEGLAGEDGEEEQEEDEAGTPGPPAVAFLLVLLGVLWRRRKTARAV